MVHSHQVFAVSPREASFEFEEEDSRDAAPTVVDEGCLVVSVGVVFGHARIIPILDFSSTENVL